MHPVTQHPPRRGGRSAKRAAAALLLAGLTAASASALSVRVDPAGGAPRIVVDGKPVRGRMFWGSPGASNLRVGDAPQQVEFEFTAEADADTGTMHFRFGRLPGQLVLDDIRVADLTAGNDLVPRCDFEGGPESFTRDWTFWPRGDANTVGSLEVVAGAGRDGSAGLRMTLRPPPEGDWPDFHLYHHPRLRIVAGRRYRASFWIRADAPRAVTTAFYRPGEPFVFLGGPPDAFDAQIRMAAQAGVDFISFPIDLPWPKPGRTSDWHGVDAPCRRVLEAHPGALLVPRIPMDPPPWWREAHADDVMQWEGGRRDKAVPASPVYRRDAAERLAEVVAHLEDRFGKHVAGYHPVGQNTGEWFYERAWERELSGFAPADREAWRAWLAGRYATDAALQAAWRDPAATRDAAALPTPASRRSAPAGFLRDAAQERMLIDWAEYQQEAMAGCVTALARAARQASRGRKLVLFFYGYTFELAGLHTGAPVSGHYALRQVLDCPDIDVLCAPISYFDRGLGGGAPAMAAAESVALAGKLWLNEDDTHTCLATEDPPGARDHVSTLEDTNRELVRNVAQAALRNQATWWMDLCASGWFNDRRMWAEMVRLRPLDEALLARPAPFRPEIAAVVDEQAMRHLSAQSARVTWPGIYEARRALGRCGAPYGQYLLDDVLAGRVDAKLFVFLNPWRLDAEQRARLAARAPGRVYLWCQPSVPAGTETNATSWMVPPGGLTPDLLRAAARQAGVHLFTTNDCNVYANGGFLALHAAQAGPVELDTGRTGTVTDVQTGRPVGQGPWLPLRLQQGETRVLRY